MHAKSEQGGARAEVSGGRTLSVLGPPSGRELDSEDSAGKMAKVSGELLVLPDSTLFDILPA